LELDEGQDARQVVCKDGGMPLKLYAGAQPIAGRALPISLYRLERTVKPFDEQSV
jgi:hypothetical protein